jgi:hypothetical protein
MLVKFTSLMVTVGLKQGELSWAETIWGWLERAYILL